MTTITLEGSDFTEEDVHWLYDIYLWNVLNLTNHMKVVERSIFDLSLYPNGAMIVADNGEMIMADNEFINQKNRLNSLGEDIYKNGMFWILTISEDDTVEDGYHRVMALRAYCEKNKTDIRFPCIQLDPSKFKEGIFVKYPYAPKIRHFKKFGQKSRIKKVYNRDDYMKEFMKIPCEYNNVFFFYREKDKFVGFPIVNCYKELMKKKNEMSVLPTRD